MMVLMTILCIDFMNAAHRARSGFTAGEHAVIYNFFRQFRALVDQFKPNRVYLALEGRPVHRHEQMTEYKANRIVGENDPRHEELMKFFKQKDAIVNLLSSYFPVTLVRHPTSEADDTIYNLIKTSSTAVPWVVVSSDTDFIQALQEFPHISLYNPVKKYFVNSPDYPYVTWKALRGDATDNIPGIPGIGDKTAEKLACDPELLSEVLSDRSKAEIFQRNYDLISFRAWNEQEKLEMTSTSPAKNWDAVKELFTSMGFQSIVKEGSWQKFHSSFDSLWGV
jgi:5'-3' exonuclease